MAISNIYVFTKIVTFKALFLLNLRLAVSAALVTSVILMTDFVSTAAASETEAEYGNGATTTQTRIDDQPVFVRKPVWELGLGAAHFSGHDYPASDDPNDASLVLPFFIYRDDVVRVAGRGVGAVAYERPRVKLDFSLGGSLSAESEGNAARAGMPDLDFLFELGPRLNVLLLRKVHEDGGTSSLRWLNSLRGIVSTDFGSIDTRGFLFKSELEFRRKRLFGSNFDFQIQLDTTLATRRLHDYFYTVRERFATPTREAFRAEGGYLSSTISTGFGYEITPAIRVFTAVSFESFGGAANEASPLFETDNTMNFAVALVWTIKSSDHSIEVFEDD